ncbi:MAG: nitroreductase [Clostridiales bacterium]|nr:nitroreductase [Clostridiales bacterium]
MDKIQLYEEIFRRKSVRKYNLRPLSNDVLAEIREFSESAKPLDNSIRYEFSFLHTADVSKLLSVKAPHYICFYSEKKGNYLMNAGFILQQVNLYLSARGLGSCWLGMAKPLKQKTVMKNDMEFVIMLAFGNANEPLHRTNPLEFRRKSLAAISSSSFDFLEPVRLAPSAVNSQPWFFSENKDEIVVSREKLNALKAPLYGRVNQIDIGIAVCHLWLSLEHRNKSILFDFTEAPVPDGYEFMAKVKIGSK